MKHKVLEFNNYIVLGIPNCLGGIRFFVPIRYKTMDRI